MRRTGRGSNRQQGARQRIRVAALCSKHKGAPHNREKHARNVIEIARKASYFARDGEKQRSEVMYLRGGLLSLAGGVGPEQ